MVLGKMIHKVQINIGEKKFKVESVLYVVSGKDEILDEEYSQSFSWCFRRRDTYFDPHIYPDCIPPDINCEN